MDKIKKLSLKFALAKYLLPCIIVSMAGILFIGHGTNYLQDWYRHTYPFQETGAYPYEDAPGRMVIYWIISNAQVFLMPLWTVLCMMGTGWLFYQMEIKKSIDTLLNASRKISENQLDFTIEAPKSNELGELCLAFENMRASLYNNNLELWRSLEERKRLNAAFSHDLRIPLTVLHGYADFLQKYVPEGKVSEEKLIEILSLMSNQISRLEHYTAKMNSLQKLDDIIPNPQDILFNALQEQLRQTGSLVCTGKDFVFTAPHACYDIPIRIDMELVMQVYENILSNAVRYAKTRIIADCSILEGMLCIHVCDDGSGFSPEALEKADTPFFRDEKEEDKTHFGLGLYICRILCEKCGGRLHVSNYEGGGRVTAEFLLSETR